MKSTEARNDLDGLLGLILRPIVLESPIYLSDPDVRHGCIPFAFWCIDVIEPSLFVELGVHKGDIYLASCQAVKARQLVTRCYGVDAWQKDRQSGYHGEDVFERLRRYHNYHYSHFSALMRSAFHDALAHFSECSIDLLHIDGLDNYDGVKGDFEAWLPKMSKRGVILLGGINAREGRFGAWKLWEQLSQLYPHFSLINGYGLGILAVGQDQSEAIRKVVSLQDSQVAEVRSIFSRLGERVLLHAELTKAHNELIAIRTSISERETQLDDLREAITQRDGEIDALRQEIAQRNTALDLVYRSRSWRILAPLRIIKDTASRSLILKNALQRTIYRVLKYVYRHLPLPYRWKMTLKNFVLSHLPLRISSHQSRSTLSESDAWYSKWIAENEPNDEVINIQREAASKLGCRPLISVIVPVYNTQVGILNDAIQSVIDQTYDKWELCLVDGKSDRKEIRPLLEEWTEKDERIKVRFLDENLGIADNSNEALSMATGEFIALLDHDDVLAQFALFEVAKAINENPRCDFIYSDEDKMTMDGKRHTPFFKPEWSPDLLQSFMYTGHLSAYRTDCVRQVGGFRSEFDLSQDYDLVLRITDISRNICHIPKVLYHWRMAPGSAASGGKGYARQSNIAALASAVQRRGYKAQVIECPMANRVKFLLEGNPLVSIIIPSDNEENVLMCLNLLLEKTRYGNLEILIVTNTHLGSRVAGKYAHDSRVRIVNFDEPFNFSAKCNKGSRYANGEYLLFLNDDVHPIDGDWLECMLGYFQQNGIGAVSPKLIYTNNSIQHAGLVTGVRGLVGTAFHQEPCESPYYFNFAQSTRTVSALSGACLLVPRKVFDAVEGFDEINAPIMHSDVDLCFKIREKGLRLVYTPFAKLRHVGHLALGATDTYEHDTQSDKVDLYLLKRWGGYVSRDPYYTQNMRDLLYHDSPVKYRLYASNEIERESIKGDLLFVTHDLSLSGAPIVLSSLAKYARGAGYHVTVVSPVHGDLLTSYRESNIPVVIDPLILNDPAAITDFINRYDLLYVNTILFWQLILRAKSRGKLVMWNIHEGDFGLKMVHHNAQIKDALSLADMVIFPAKTTEAMYRQKIAGRGNFRTVYCGVRKEELATPLKIKEGGRMKVLLLGSIEPRKGQDVLIKAIKCLPPEVREVSDFHIVGRVLDVDYYNALIAEKRPLGNIHWVGEVSQEKAREYVRECDVLVCASRDEVLPVVLIEAMALGKAIVSSAIGGVPEVMEDEFNALLFASEDYRGLERCLERVCEDHLLREKLGHAAMATFERLFTLDKYEKNIFDLISSVI